MAALRVCLLSALATACGAAIDHMSVLQAGTSLPMAEVVDEQPGPNPMANPPWWISAGVTPSGPEKQMNGYKAVTFSAEQQAKFGIDENGGITDMGKFNAAMEKIGHPELKDFAQS